MKPAILALANGRIFRGRSIGAAVTAVGEVVFNTAMTGYQEILTDPSYANQLVTLTYPHIGNTGVNDIDEESDRPHALGLIVRDYPRLHSNWQATGALGNYLKNHNVAGISDIDTRALTRVLREEGAQNGCLMTGEVDEAKAIELARGFAGLEGMDLAKEVCTKESYEFIPSFDNTLSPNPSPTSGRGEHAVSHPVGSPLPTGEGQGQGEGEFPVVSYDFGCKRNILNLLAERGAKIKVVPAQTPASEVLAMNPAGVFLSNGPGDPAACDYAIQNIQTLLEANMPLFGICLGHQLLALALGAKTMKMKFGHHGANHPVQDLSTKQVLITSQNHGFVVDETTLPDDVEVTHRSLFDGSNQGIAHKTKPAFSFQGHPEASPGPHDVLPLFDRFFELMKVST